MDREAGSVTNSHDLKPLVTYSRDVTSQFGEDGMIEEIFRRLGNGSVCENGWCVEFGAWDGMYLSNTYNLIKNWNFSGVLIEGDASKVAEISTNLPFDRVTTCRRWIEIEGKNSLDAVLAETEIPNDFDFLSIDIDGCDYHVFASLCRFRPKVICIEFNPTIPNEVIFVQAPKFAIKQGSSARAIVDLAHSKNYALVACTKTNLLLVACEYAKLVIGDNEPSLDSLRDDEDQRVYFFSGYDGSLLSNKEFFELPWHKFKVPVQEINPLPRWLRQYPGDNSKLQNLLLRGYKILRRRLSSIIAGTS